MTTPIEAMLDDVEFTPTGAEPDPSGLPYATHTGVLNIMGLELPCARLSNGQAVFYGELIESMVAGLKTLQEAQDGEK